MTDLIHRMATWVSLFLNPRGAHRRTTARPPLLILTPPWPRAMSLPIHRSPYGLDADTPLDAAATRTVRPYLGVA